MNEVLRLSFLITQKIDLKLKSIYNYVDFIREKKNSELDKDQV